jgi:hypothetical protein
LLYCRFCSEGCLNNTLVKGKIVLCDGPNVDAEANRAGAVGSILKNYPFDDISSVVSLPTSSLSVDKYDIVASYLNSTKYGFLYIVLFVLFIFFL